MPSAPSISVIIATYNQADKLAVTLRALAELDLSGVPAFEVVIADNGSGPDVTAIIADFAATAPFPVKALREHRQGSSYARNTAIKASSGDLFMCIDQDCVVEPNWVQAALLIFSDTLHKLAGGRVELFDPTDQSITTKTSLEREVAMHARDTITIMLGANFAFGRSVIERIGVFDVRLGAGSRHKAGDDVDFAYRAFKAGIPVTYEPSMVLAHNHGRKTLAERKRLQFGYEYGLGGMVAKSVLAGHTDALKALYWFVRARIRDVCLGKVAAWELAGMAMTVPGAIRFLATQSWKPAT